MRNIFFCLALFLNGNSFAQCPIAVTLNSSGGNCLGATLNVAGSSTFSKIVWYNGNVVVNTVSGAAVDGVTVAGGNGLGPAANQFDDVWGIYVDGNGTVYLADIGNERIQKWPAGATSAITVAGGNGTGAAANQFFGATGVYLDAGGNIYVVDQYNDRIQMWAPGAGSGVTVAGGTGAGPAASQLNNPLSIHVDGSGNLYIADAINERIQKWAAGASSGVTVAGGHGAGSAANQFDGPFSVFVDGSGNVYVCDLLNHRIQKWAPGAASGVTVAGGNGAGSAANQLYFPTGVFVDGSGNIYVVDGNNRIQKWAPGATTGTTVAGGNGSGTAANQLSGPSAVWVDGIGNIYVADQLNFRIQKFMPQAPVNTTYTPVTAGTYTAAVTDNSGCTVTTNAIVINPIIIPSVSISTPVTAICAGTPVAFTASPGNGGTDPVFQWQVNGVNASVDSPVYTNAGLANGDIVTCVMTSNASCTSTPTARSNAIDIKIIPGLPASVGIGTPSDTSCEGMPMRFFASVGNGNNSISCQWQVNGQNQGDNSTGFVSSSLSSGDIVSCTVDNGSGCAPAVSNAIRVVVNPNPTISAGQIFSLSAGQGVTLNPVIAGNIDSFIWRPSTGLSDSTIRNPIANPLKSTNYILHIVSADGCEATGEIAVKVFSRLRIPNAFTPNSDGRNDIFYVLGGPEGSRIKDFLIFNRWGQTIFKVHDGQPDDPHFGWDGNFNGKPAASDTYVYSITVRLVDGTEQVFRGTIILVR